MSSYWDVASDQGMWAPFIFESLLGGVHAFAPWLEDFSASFFTLKRGSGVPEDAFTAGNLLHDALVCDFDSLMFCGRQKGTSGRV